MIVAVKWLALHILSLKVSEYENINILFTKGNVIDI